MTGHQQQPAKVHSRTDTLQPWQDDGLRRGLTMVEAVGVANLSAGIFECEPSERTYVLEQNELVHVLRGSATVVLEPDSVLELREGDFAFLPAGRVSRWTFHTTFRELWILVT